MATELTRSLEPEVLRPWHKTLADIVLSSPELTQREIAKRLNRSEYWLSIVINSDAFQHYIAERRRDLHDPIVVERFEDKIAAVGSMAIDRIGERLESRAPMTNDELLAAATFAAKCAGLGAPKPGAGVNLYVVNTPGPATNSATWAENAGGRVTDITPRE